MLLPLPEELCGESLELKGFSGRDCLANRYLPDYSLWQANSKDLR